MNKERISFELWGERPQDALVCGSGMWLSSLLTLPPDPAAAMGLVQHAVEQDEFSPSAGALLHVGHNLTSLLTNTALPTASLGQRKLLFNYRGFDFDSTNFPCCLLNLQGFLQAKIKPLCKSCLFPGGSRRSQAR